MTKVLIEGDKVFYASMKRLAYNTQIEMNEMFVRTGHELRNNIQLSMRNTVKRTTKPVKRGGKYHFPSLPGFPPAIDSGRLVNDIKVSVDRSGLSNVRVEVGDVSQKHGQILEETENPRLKRPWLEPAYDNLNIEDRIALIFERNINRL